MLTLSLTALTVLAGLAAAHALRIGAAAERWLFAGTSACATIVLVQTILGATGLLTRPAVALTTIVVAAAVAAASVFAARAAVGGAWRAELATLREAARLLRHPEIAALAVMAAAAFAWVLVAAALLPPRSVDDLGHHLPPVFEAAVRGRFVLPPLNLHPWFAYPLNADLLSLWPVVLERSIALVNFAQAGTAGLAALSIAALARLAQASRRMAVFCGLVFLLLPVTLRQAGACYTDVTIAAFFGAAAVGVAGAFEQGRATSLLLAGLGAGLLAGTKYHMLFAVLLMLPLVAVAARRCSPDARRRAGATLLFAAPVLALASFWLLRNLLELGNPCYPYRVGLGPLTIFANRLPADSPLLGSPPLLLGILRTPATVWRIVFTDCGLGNVDGGLGPVFWGAVAPLGFWCAAAALWRLVRRRGSGGLALGLLFLAGAFPYAASQAATAGVTTRFLLTAAVPGFAMLAAALTRRLESTPVVGRAAVVGVALIAGLGVVQLGGDREPNERKQTMNFGPAAAARAQHAFASPWRFVQNAAFGPNRLAPARDFLDLVTAPPGEAVRPLWIYATSRSAAGFYGRRLQNRIWNFGAPDRPATPDALVYYFARIEGVEKVEASGDKIPWEDIAGRRDRCELVFATPETAVFFRRELLAPGGDMWRRILAYYEKADPTLAVVAAKTALPFAEGDVVLATDPLGFGLKALEMTSRLRYQVLLVHRREIDALVGNIRTTGTVWLVAPATANGPTATRTVQVGDRLVGFFVLKAASR